MVYVDVKLKICSTVFVIIFYGVGPFQWNMFGPVLGEFGEGEGCIWFQAVFMEGLVVGEDQLQS